MIVEDVANVGEKTHIWLEDKILFDGEYSIDNLYSKRKIHADGYEEDVGSEPVKWYCSIELE